MWTSIKSGCHGIMSIIWAKTRTLTGAYWSLLWIMSWELEKNGWITHSYCMGIKKGDMVACYITNTNEWQVLVSWGIVLEINPSLGDVLILDNDGQRTWWPQERWRVVSSKKQIKNLDIEIKLA